MCWYMLLLPRVLVPGIVNNGALLTGSTGAAGEIGHTTIDIHGPRCSCGNYGCLEGYCSSITFVKKLNEAFGKKDELTFSDAVLLVRKKDPTAVKLYVKCVITCLLALLM